MENQKTLWSVNSGDKIRIIDEVLLKQLPKLKDKEMIVSVVKNQSGCIFFQYFDSNKGCGTLKIPFKYGSICVEVLGKTDIQTLGNLIKDYNTKWELRDTQKPTEITLNINGRVESFKVGNEFEFWNQNYNNIKLTHLTKWGQRYSIPGSSIVVSHNGRNLENQNNNNN